MYNLNSFIEYTGQSLNKDDIILVWSKNSGYIFICSKFLENDFKIIAIES